MKSKNPKKLRNGNIGEEQNLLSGDEVYRKYNVDVVELERTSLFITDTNKTITQIDNDGHTKTTRYQYDNHLGSASIELDEHANLCPCYLDTFEKKQKH